MKTTITILGIILLVFTWIRGVLTHENNLTVVLLWFALVLKNIEYCIKD